MLQLVLKARLPGSAPRASESPIVFAPWPKPGYMQKQWRYCRLHHLRSIPAQITITVSPLEIRVLTQCRCPDCDRCNPASQVKATTGHFEPMSSCLGFERTQKTLCVESASRWRSGNGSSTPSGCMNQGFVWRQMFRWRAGNGIFSFWMRVRDRDSL